MSSNRRIIDCRQESELYDYSFAKDSIELKERIETHKIRNILDYDKKVL
jgi:hypothetical protein